MDGLTLDPKTDTIASVPRHRQPLKRPYMDKHFPGGEEEWEKLISKSTTVYVGNLSIYTNEYQIYELFTRCGSIRRMIMGLNRTTKKPCGFCFVEYDERESALDSISFLNNTPLDGRDLQVGMDAGFVEGRQFGRGQSGGQIADERYGNRNRDPGNGPNRQSTGGSEGGTPILTRSITVVACIAVLSIILIAAEPSLVNADIIIRPNPMLRSQYLNPLAIKRAQLTENRDQFEKAFAQFLVNIMKSAKPSLMQAFIQATLADKKLKEIAIGIFFNNTETDND